jgi:hypothetical protein
MQRKPVVPPIAQLLLLLVGAAAIFLIVLQLVQQSSSPLPGAGTPVTPLATPLFPTPSPLPAETDRSDPAIVHSRVMVGLKRDDAAAIFNELSPERRASTDYAAFAQAMQDQVLSAGPVISDVQLLRPPIISGTEWADAEVAVVREKETTRYLTRYHLEAGRAWWLDTFQVLTSTVVQP